MRTLATAVANRRRAQLQLHPKGSRLLTGALFSEKRRYGLVQIPPKSSNLSSRWIQEGVESCEAQLRNQDSVDLLDYGLFLRTQYMCLRLEEAERNPEYCERHPSLQDYILSKVDDNSYVSWLDIQWRSECETGLSFTVKGKEEYIQASVEREFHTSGNYPLKNRTVTLINPSCCAVVFCVPTKEPKSDFWTHVDSGDDVVVRPNVPFYTYDFWLAKMLSDYCPVVWIDPGKKLFGNMAKCMYDLTLSRVIWKRFQDYFEVSPGIKIHSALDALPSMAYYFVVIQDLTPQVAVMPRRNRDVAIQTDTQVPEESPSVGIYQMISIPTRSGELAHFYRMS